MPKFEIKKITFFEWFALLFVRKQKFISYDEEINTDVMIIYKKFRGATYIINTVIPPPKHYNCKCSILPLDPLAHEIHT